MFVVDLSIDKLVGNKDEGTFSENPTWQQIEATICELNGKNQTLVTLGSDEESYMSIGGGEAGKYIVNVTFDGVTFYNLVDRSQTDRVESLVVGGQLGNYPAKLLANLDSVLLVAKSFAQTGKLEESLTWEEDESLARVG